MHLYSVFHLNLACASLEEEERPAVIERCYWPLLQIARELRVPLGIELSGSTLEQIAALDPVWIAELRALLKEGVCELVGSGYAPIIGPLVPVEVNAANLRLGNQVYRTLLGASPRVALVCEQAYAAGLIRLYLEAGYEAVFMEWNTPAQAHADWPREARTLPQRALGVEGESIALLWNDAIACQRFQRYAHGELDLEGYLAYLERHLGEGPRAFPLYGNDLELFGFRPGRHQVDPVRTEGEGGTEWKAIEALFAALLADPRFRLVLPSQVLPLGDEPGGGCPLRLESPDQPAPVRLQGKLNITRWAVTGRDALGINTACHRLHRRLVAHGIEDEADWKRLCALWSSDFRTNVTPRRWEAYRRALAEVEDELEGRAPLPLADASPRALPSPPAREARIETRRHFLCVDTGEVKVSFNLRRGLALEGLWWDERSGPMLCGTLPDDFYQDALLGADFYTGHVVMESPGCALVTDLAPVEPEVAEQGEWVVVQGAIPTPLGIIYKRIGVSRLRPRVELSYLLDWPELPPGSLRLGYVTLHPAAFDAGSLFFRTRNGGCRPETFAMGEGEQEIDHGGASSFLVSARHALGITDGIVEIGDARRSLRLEVDQTKSALVGLVTFRKLPGSYFCRLTFSLQELDETCPGYRKSPPRLTCSLVLTPGGGLCAGG